MHQANRYFLFSLSLLSSLPLLVLITNCLLKEPNYQIGYNTPYLLSTIAANAETLGRVKSANASLRELEGLVDQLIAGEGEGEGEEEEGEEEEREKASEKRREKGKGKLKN
jgi:hypothetical protein